MMLAVFGTQITCTFGLAPSVIIPTQKTVLAEGRPVVQITDIAPVTNIPPFAMCQSMANPAVAAATSSAGGVLTPMPCTPLITAPWSPPAQKTLVAGIPAATVMSRCTCAYGGSIGFAGGAANNSMAR